MAPITPTEAIEMLRILGLSVRLDGAKLFVSPAALIDDDVSWLIRTHKTEIVRELQNDSPTALKNSLTCRLLGLQGDLAVAPGILMQIKSIGGAGYA